MGRDDLGLREPRPWLTPGAVLLLCAAAVAVLSLIGSGPTPGATPVATGSPTASGSTPSPSPSSTGASTTTAPATGTATATPSETTTPTPTQTTTTATTTSTTTTATTTTPVGTASGSASPSSGPTTRDPTPARTRSVAAPRRVARPEVGPDLGGTAPPPPGAVKVLASLAETRERPASTAAAAGTDAPTVTPTVTPPPATEATRAAEAQQRRWHVRLAGRDAAVPFALLALGVLVAWAASSLRASGAHRRR